MKNYDYCDTEPGQMARKRSKKEVAYRAIGVVPKRIVDMTQFAGWGVVPKQYTEGE